MQALIQQRKFNSSRIWEITALFFCWTGAIMEMIMHITFIAAVYMMHYIWMTFRLTVL